MEDLGLLALKAFTGFFAIMNPIASIPIFIGLTQNFDARSQKLIGRRALLVAFIIVTIFVVGGKFLFDFFGITVPAFQITGGILVFFIGFEMLQSKESSIKSTNLPGSRVSASQDTIMNIAVSPLGTPLLAGPGTIVTSMSFVTEDAGPLQILTVVLTFGVICLLTYLAFLFSDRLVKLIGQNVIKVFGKIMGLILGVIGTDMFLRGVKAAFGLL